MLLSLQVLKALLLNKLEFSLAYLPFTLASLQRFLICHEPLLVPSGHCWYVYFIIRSDECAVILDVLDSINVSSQLLIIFLVVVLLHIFAFENWLCCIENFGSALVESSIVGNDHSNNCYVNCSTAKSPWLP